MKWKEYWNDNNTNNNLSFYEKFAKFYRRNLFALEGKVYADRYFSKKGIFIECGSGTSECSIKIPKKKRHGIAFDLCNSPLKRIDAQIIENSVQGTIFSLPFKDGTIDGIWNFGVMEHFTERDLDVILKEFNRVIKKGGRIVLFWPWIYSPLSLSFSLRGLLIKMVSQGRTKYFSDVYPNVVILFKSKKSIQFILENSGFFKTEFKLSPYGLFTHYVVAATK